MPEPWEATPLPFPNGYPRGETIGPLIVPVDVGEEVVDGMTVDLEFFRENRDSVPFQRCSSVPSRIVGGGTQITITPNPANPTKEATVTAAKWNPAQAGLIGYRLRFRWPNDIPTRTPHAGWWRIEENPKGNE